MFTRRYNDKRYKVISEDGCGLQLRVPRYKKTGVRIGNKAEAERKGLKPKGKNNFYMTVDGSAVIDGYLTEPTTENRVEIRIRGSVAVLSASHWEYLKAEFENLLNH